MEPEGRPPSGLTSATGKPGTFWKHVAADQRPSWRFERLAVRASRFPRWGLVPRCQINSRHERLGQLLLAHQAL
jgi:hypothetical protein